MGERRTSRVAASLDDPGRLRKVAGEPMARWSLGGMVLITLAIVFVMVTKASLFG